MPLVDVRHLRGAWKAVDQGVHPIPWASTVLVTASPVLRLRKSPTVKSVAIGSLPHGHRQGTRRLEKFGGRYTTASGKVRADWLEVSHGGHTGWIARGYTRTV
jgi:hypothetical protein